MLTTNRAFSSKLAYSQSMSLHGRMHKLEKCQVSLSFSQGSTRTCPSSLPNLILCLVLHNPLEVGKSKYRI